MTMNAAIYCRVSTEDQEREGTSLDSQREACITKAQELGHEVLEHYVFLETWSGAETDRPQLNELRHLVRQRIISCVVCYATDRLARNPIHIAIIAEECEKRGIELVFVTEPLDKSPEGALIRYVKGYAAQIEREKIRERTLRGKREKARAGKLSTGGPRLFGYDVENRKRVINPAEAELVKQIYHWFAYEGYTLYRAAAEFNRAGIKAPRGGRWTEHTVYRLLINPAYKGETFAFRYKTVEPQRPKVAQRSYTKTTHIFRDRKEWIEIPGATPAIVTSAVWGMAHDQLQKNRLQSSRNRKHGYLLTNGRLRCGVCGHSMTGSFKKRANGDWLLYRCLSNVKTNYYPHCPQRSIAASKIEPIVWEEITKILKDPSLVLQELNKQRRETTPAALEAEEILLENRIKQALKEERRYLHLYGQGKFDEKMLLKETEQVRHDRQSLESQLAKLKEQQEAAEKANAHFEDVTEVVSLLATQLEDADYELKQLALDALDIRATLYPDGRLEISGVIPTEAQLLDANSWHYIKQYNSGVRFCFSGAILNRQYR